MADDPAGPARGPDPTPEPENQAPPADHPDPDYLPAPSGSVVPPTFEETMTWLELLVEPGQVTEVRILEARDPQRPNAGPFTLSGFYEVSHLGSLVEAARGWTHHAKGVYVTLNPVDPELLAVRRNRCEKYAKETAGDEHILRRRWLMVDIDPYRYSETTDRKITAGVSATDAEKARARGVAEAIYRFLKGRSWPDPVAVDSGNGYQLLYRIDEPTDDGGLVKRCLQALADKFDDDGAEVDRKVFNPARIAKLPGTLARKGEDSGE